MRPYIICHMAASLDGRIDCDMTEKLEAGNEYYDALDKLNCPSTLMGRVTMQMHYALPGTYSAADKTPIGETAWNKTTDADGYIIAIDTMGRLLWPANSFDGMPLIVVTGEACPKERLDRLTAQGISWIATGEQRIDLGKAMEILHDEFGVRRLSVTGGGNINGAFLEAGLLDEVSMVFAPGIDGRAGMVAAFDGIADKAHEPVKLKLISIEKLAEEVWLRYKV